MLVRGLLSRRVGAQRIPLGRDHGVGGPLQAKIIQLDRQAWQYARVSEAVWIAFAVTIATLVLLIVDLTLGTTKAGRALPISVILIAGILNFLGARHVHA